MTTTARPAQGQTRGTTHRVLLGAGAVTLGVILVTALAGGLADGRPAALGAGVGGGLSLTVLFLGALTVAAATAVSPSTSLLVAMTTFLLVVVTAGAGFYVLDASGAVGTSLASGWVAGGVAAAAAAWSAAHLVGHARSRVLAFDTTTRSSPRPTSGPGSIGDEGAARGAAQVRVP